MEGIGVIEKRKSRLGKIGRVCLELAIIAGTAVGGWNIADRTYSSMDIDDLLGFGNAFANYKAQKERDLRWALTGAGLASAVVIGRRLYSRFKD